MIVDADVKAERDDGEVNVAGVAVVVAVGNAEGELTLTQRIAVVNGEESSRPSRRATRADGRSPPLRNRL